MKNVSRYSQLAVLLFALLSVAGRAEDIDIFAGTTEANPSLPNVIFVLDNTSNWSRESQKWPGGVDQGQSEVRAIKTALASQVGKLNVGIMGYVTGGSAADTDAGYTRLNLQELTTARLGASDSTDPNTLNGILNTIFSNINSPEEKRSSSNPYGDLPWDFYNYLGGKDHSNGGTGTSSLADALAYTTKYSKFKSPLRAADVCADTYMIFVGNNANGAVAVDDATNSNALKAAYSAAGATAPDALAGSSTGTPLKMPGFTTTTVTVPEQVVPPVTEPGAWIPPVVITPAQPEVYHPEVKKVVTQEAKPEVVVAPVMSAPIAITAATGWSVGCYKDTKAATLAACKTAENSGPTGGLCAGDAAGLGLCSCSATLGADCGSGATKGNLLAVTRIAGTKPPVVITPGYTIPAVPEICGPCEDIPAYTEPAKPEVIQPGTGVYGPDVIITPGYTIPAYTTDVVTASGTYNTTTGRAYNFDDWTKFLYNYGVPVTVTNKDGDAVSERVKATTYVIDVFNAQRSADLSSVWFSAANNGGGRYFQAKSEAEILAAINTAVGDILAVSSSFAAVSLPLSATNRARVDNQVYIGMFRPAPGKAPRWFGNLKRFQLALFDGVPRLADVNLHSAVNPLDDSLVDCSESFWTEDSGTYWDGLAINPSTRGKCNDLDVTTSPWSDLPDGSFVEKGGVAQQTRQGPNATSRLIYTVESDTALRALTSGDGSADATALGDDSVLSYLRGGAAGLGEIMPDTGLRASIHGDVVHSRPLSIRHSADAVTLYYGANDGVFRAVNAADGSERWALVAPEHFDKISRLYNNLPQIAYTGAAETGSELKDYFFDGPTGQITVYDEDGALDLAMIFPTQRRGGRMTYALKVTDPNEPPDLLWRVGCPNLDDDAGCTSGFSDVGQSWSMPIGGYVKAEDADDDPILVAMFGGGFDDCLNEDVAAYPSACSGAKGKGVYILDASDGALLKKLDTDAPVITELSPIDINFDGYIDFAYAADVKGNLYRISFAVMDGSPLTELGGGLAALAEDDWNIVKIAANDNDELRFYNAPTAAALKGIVAVALGSGDRERPLERNYPYSDDVQNRFFTFFDEPLKTFVPNPSVPLLVNQATTVDLDGATMLEVVAPSDGEEPESYSQELDGWYMDLADRGEQVANPAAIGAGKVFFNTFQPGGTSNGLCSRPLGIGTGYAVNLFGPEYTTGTLIEGPGIPIPPVIATLLIPPGLPPCDGDKCPEPPEDSCANAGDCISKTVCIGCDGFEPVELIPDAPPIRRRIFFTENGEI